MTFCWQQSLSKYLSRIEDLSCRLLIIILPLNHDIMLSTTKKCTLRFHGLCKLDGLVLLVFNVDTRYDRELTWFIITSV